MSLNVLGIILVSLNLLLKNNVPKEMCRNHKYTAWWTYTK